MHSFALDIGMLMHSFGLRTNTFTRHTCLVNTPRTHSYADHETHTSLFFLRMKLGMVTSGDYPTSHSNNLITHGDCQSGTRYLTITIGHREESEKR